MAVLKGSKEEHARVHWLVEEALGRGRRFRIIQTREHFETDSIEVKVAWWPKHDASNYVKEQWLRIPRRKLEDMANVWTNTWNTTTGTSSATTTDTLYFSDMRNKRDYFINEYVSNKVGSVISSKPKPKNFHEELQRELDDFLAGALT